MPKKTIIWEWQEAFYKFGFGDGDSWNGTYIIENFLEDTEQVFRELVHENTDYSFDISRTRGRNTYKARSSSHDCPTGSYFVLSFRERRYLND